ncbi:MAG TPA: hypothetical protein VKV05_01435, partial [Terriglobales bacterium]|nr:hypothetical protein [Terriglobales bacterium]
MKRSFLWLLCLLPLPAVTQQPSPPAAAAIPAQASVRFGFDWSQGFPWQSYSITVQSDGKARFEGIPHPDETSDSSPYHQDFTITEANCQKIFMLAEKLNYFQGNFEAHLKHVAQTGQKTLQYQSPHLQGSTTYNFSQDPDVQELTRLFTGIAMTIDYGRKLAFQYRYDKLGLDERLKELEGLVASHGVEELALLVPMLEKIADDPDLMNIS